jgi:hypothetical protein
MRITLIAVFTAGAVLTQTGCSNAPPSSPLSVSGAGTGALPGVGVSAGTGATTAGTQGTGKACEQITTDPSLAMNACNNAHDKCLDTSNTSMIRSVSGKCATGAIMGASGESCSKYAGDPTTPAAVACFDDCARTQLKQAIGDTLSDACLACADAVVTCGAKFCLIDCINDPLAPGCTACLCQTHPDAVGPGKAGNCLQDVYSQCTGYKVTAEAVGCTGLTGAAGTMATTGPTGAAGVAATAGTGAAASGSAGTGAIAGTGAGGMSGAGGTGAGGTSAAGTGGTVPAGPHTCLKAPNNVVFLGDSYINYAIAHPELNGLVAGLAIKDGALQAGQNYPDYAVAGTTIAAGTPQIPGQWESAKAANPNVQFVVMDGGGNDVLINNRQCLAAGSDKNAGCQMVVAASLAAAKKMWASMEAAKVQDVVMFWYPHTPPVTGGNDISDYAYAMLVSAAMSASTPTFRVHMVDTVAAFTGHMEYFFSDNIHANATGEAVIADLVWKAMKDNCIAQATGNACCMP